MPGPPFPPQLLYHLLSLYPIGPNNNYRKIKHKYKNGQVLKHGNLKYSWSNLVICIIDQTEKFTILKGATFSFGNYFIYCYKSCNLYMEYQYTVNSLVSTISLSPYINLGKLSYLGYIFFNTKVSYELIYIKQTLFTFENLIKPHQQSMTGSDNKKEDSMLVSM